MPEWEKFEAAAAWLPKLPSYRYYAFLDDDLSVSTDELNRLFSVGESLRLGLYQPALHPLSFGSWPELFQRKPYLVRPSTLVEIMCPFFSAAVLEDALPTFDLNCSAWGIDCYLWPKIAQGYVVDAIPIGHYRKPGRRERKLRNGLTPQQELWIQTKIHNPQDYSLPPL